ncbi:MULTISPECIES: hypothetical protein [Sphingomonadaceae]|uniref:Uncharacterized protein n=1 Tax=Novosphingobium soli TaxID=574956 RepID=A0ABV6D0E0_9SPHN|nr:hypothetical protein [Sphingomonas zeae]MBB4049347.1 hypothetical protein [Sphingomonas zeae]
MSKATRPKGGRACLVSGFEHPVPTPARLIIQGVPPAVRRRWLRGGAGARQRELERDQRPELWWTSVRLSSFLMEPEDKDPVVSAIGGTLGIIGALLARAGVASLEEFAGALSVYARVTRETDPDQAEILDQWVSMLRTLAARSAPPN